MKGDTAPKDLCVGGQGAQLSWRWVVTSGRLPARGASLEETSRGGGEMVPTW